MISILREGKWLCILAAGLLSQGAVAAVDYNFAGSLTGTTASSMQFNSGGIQVTVTSSSGTVYQDTRGLGVPGGLGNGLNNNGETLTLTFNQAVNVGGIGFGGWDYTTGLPEIAVVGYNGTSQSFESSGLFTFPCSGATSNDCYALGPAGPLTQLTVTSGNGALLTNFFVNELCDVTPVPLPAAIWLFGSGLIGLGAVKRHRRV